MIKKDECNIVLNIETRDVSEKILKDIYKVIDSFLYREDESYDIIGLQIELNSVVEKYIASGDCTVYNNDTGCGIKIITEVFSLNPYTVGISVKMKEELVRVCDLVE